MTSPTYVTPKLLAALRAAIRARVAYESARDRYDREVERATKRCACCGDTTRGIVPYHVTERLRKAGKREDLCLSAIRRQIKATATMQPKRGDK